MAPTIPAHELDHIFPGNSEMARLMRDFDWSTSEVGVPGKWPESLKAAVRICVGSRNPIVIWWGKKALTQIYNDGYMRILTAAKHPQWLGRSGAECWAEIMETMGPLWDQVLESGEATWFEDFLYIMNRNLPKEECYFTFSYSALRNDAGAVDGILCICYETTSRVIGDGRLRTLRDLGRTVAAAQTPEAACKVAAEIMGANLWDIPFSLLYLLDDDRKHCRLVATSGFANESEAGAREVNLTSSAKDSGWPLRHVLEQGSAEVVADLPSRIGMLPGGAWPEPPESAIVMPITSGGQTRGFLVAGYSNRRIADADYNGFLDLVAGHISTAIGNARAYQEEKKRAEALAELDRSKTIFFSNVSHEFRTPLTLLMGPLEDELREQSVPSERLTIAHRNALRLLKLVNTLLDFSRIEAGRIEACYEPTDLGALTADLASAFRSAFEKAGLRLSVDSEQLNWNDVYVDPEMWEKIVLNLLSNAFKFTFEGGVSVSIASPNGRVELSVADTGVGISASELPRIFDRFHRVRGARSRSFEGTGIGLALVQELVKLHGGEISVRSREGKGTTFTVTIPLGRSHLPRERLSAARTLDSTASGAVQFVEEALRWLPDSGLPDSGTEAGGAEIDRAERLRSPMRAVAAEKKRRRILLADDNADMRDYLRRLLLPQFDVTAVGDGEAAFAAACEHHPDLVLSDVMMPRLDGFGLIERLRSHPETNAIPIILLSARAGEEARVEGLQRGADDYVTKPFSARELLARVRTALELQDVRREAAEAIRRLNTALSVELTQKEALLKEVHHRVKNNLQVITSMLNLQANQIRDESVLALFDQTRNRVYSIAAIHELLYRSVSFAEIGLVDYARQLVPELARFYQLEDRVHVRVEGDSSTLEIQRAVPYGLLLNELVSNACKHAFPGGRAGSLEVRVTERDGRIALTVADDGIGLPRRFDCENPNRLGLRLVRMLGLQLGGSVNLFGEEGTIAVVEFPQKIPDEACDDER